MFSRTDARVGLSMWQGVFDVFESSGWARTQRYVLTFSTYFYRVLVHFYEIILHTSRILNVRYLQISVLGDSTVSHIASNVLAANVNSSLLMVRMCSI